MANNLVRVLIVAGAMNVGGTENQLMHLLRQADKDCFQIDFTTTAAHPFYQDEIEALGGCAESGSAETVAAKGNERAGRSGKGL